MSGRVGASIAFAYTTAVMAFLIAWLMHRRIASFAIVAVDRAWDLDEKSAACRNAGLMYLVLAVGLSLHSAYTHYRTRTLRLERHMGDVADARESMPLLCATLFNTRSVDDIRSIAGSNNNRGGYDVSYGFRKS